MYKRVLLKFSGEALSGDGEEIFDLSTITNLAEAIISLHNENVEIGIVIGGGNICRGATQAKMGFDRVNGDYMGMLSTVMNAIAISSVLRQKGVETALFSALGPVSDLVKMYDVEEAKKQLSLGKICFFAGGVGKPYFTTDTGAAKRALEVEVDAILMGKHGVNGVYDKDPIKHKDAKFYKDITYQQMLDLGIMVMDQSAVELLKDSNIEIRVFSAQDANNYVKVAHGDNSIGTTCRRG